MVVDWCGRGFGARSAFDFSHVAVDPEEQPLNGDEVVQHAPTRRLILGARAIQIVITCLWVVHALSCYLYC